jgi:hypothetical protein
MRFIHLLLDTSVGLHDSRCCLLSLQQISLNIRQIPTNRAYEGWPAFMTLLRMAPPLPNESHHWQLPPSRMVQRQFCILFKGLQYDQRAKVMLLVVSAYRQHKVLLLQPVHVPEGCQQTVKTSHLAAFPQFLIQA